MASGDDIKAGRATGANSTTFLVGEKIDDDNPPDFAGDVIFVVGPLRVPARSPGHTVGGILGIGTNGSPTGPPEVSRGGVGITGFGGQNQGTGVLGVGSGEEHQGGIGVHGQGGDNIGPSPVVLNPGVGVLGQGGVQDDLQNTTGKPYAPGVVGVAGGGVAPSFEDSGSVGVFGQGGNAKRPGPKSPGTGVVGRGGIGTSDVQNPAGVGVMGLAGDATLPTLDFLDVGVYGRSRGGIGVAGILELEDNSFAAVVGVTTHGAEPPFPKAGYFDGTVEITGDLIVHGAKSAAVPHHDGSHRLLYCVESPESWFEDFGEGTLISGQAEVQLDPNFAAVIKTDKYHVFVTPYGDSNGLYVTQRGSKGFLVKEQNNGQSNLDFSYKIVANRKDISAERLAKIELSNVPRLSLLAGNRASARQDV